MDVGVEKERWIVCGRECGSVVVMNREDGKKRDRVEKMSDCVSCLYWNWFWKERKEKNFVLVGRGDGKLGIFEDKSVKVKGGGGLKIVNIGNVSSGLMCLSEWRN